MPRFFLAPDAWVAEPVLDGDEARHFARVLRGRAGDMIAVFDGCGRRAEALVTEAGRGWLRLRLGQARQAPPPCPAVALGQAIPKGKTMDLIVQKAVELGVALIQPLVTRHTVVQPGEGKGDKWQRVALEACKQCGQDHLPRVAPVATLDDWLGRGGATAGPRLLASLVPGAPPLREIARALPGPPAQVTVLIGPEGDFAPEETAAALAAGFQPVSLGPVVLRVETAALFCLSALRYEFAR